MTIFGRKVEPRRQTNFGASGAPTRYENKHFVPPARPNATNISIWRLRNTKTLRIRRPCSARLENLLGRRSLPLPLPPLPGPGRDRLLERLDDHLGALLFCIVFRCLFGSILALVSLPTWLPKSTKIPEKSMPRCHLSWAPFFDRFLIGFGSQLGPI